MAEGSYLPAAKNCYALGAGFMESILDWEDESEARYRNYNYGEPAYETGKG